MRHFIVREKIIRYEHVRTTPDTYVFVLEVLSSHSLQESVHFVGLLPRSVYKVFKATDISLLNN